MILVRLFITTKLVREAVGLWETDRIRAIIGSPAFVKILVVRPNMLAQKESRFGLSEMVLGFGELDKRPVIVRMPNISICGGLTRHLGNDSRKIFGNFMLPTETIQIMEQRAATIREVAQAISDRLIQLQEFFTELKGRRETEVVLLPDKLEVRLCRGVGKGWIIQFSEFKDEKWSNWAPILDATLLNKTTVLKHALLILEHVEAEQTNLLKELEACIKEYDDGPGKYFKKEA